MKLSPFLTAPANFCMQLAEAGAKGVVLFNRFYQPDIDLEYLEVVNNLNLSRSEELRLPLRWTALLAERSRPTSPSPAASTAAPTWSRASSAEPPPP